jgi:hypothetical protein
MGESRSIKVNQGGDETAMNQKSDPGDRPQKKG